MVSAFFSQAYGYVRSKHVLFSDILFMISPGKFHWMSRVRLFAVYCSAGCQSCLRFFYESTTKNKGPVHDASTNHTQRDAISSYNLD
jgi:hypothetical protein